MALCARAASVARAARAQTPRNAKLPRLDIAHMLDISSCLALGSRVGAGTTTATLRLAGQRIPSPSTTVSCSALSWNVTVADVPLAIITFSKPAKAYRSVGPRMASPWATQLARGSRAPATMRPLRTPQRQYKGWTWLSLRMGLG